MLIVGYFSRFKLLVLGDGFLAAGIMVGLGVAEDVVRVLLEVSLLDPVLLDEVVEVSSNLLLILLVLLLLLLEAEGDLLLLEDAFEVDSRVVN